MLTFLFILVLGALIFAAVWLIQRTREAAEPQDTLPGPDRPAGEGPDRPARQTEPAAGETPPAAPPPAGHPEARPPGGGASTMEDVSPTGRAPTGGASPTAADVSPPPDEPPTRP